MDKRVIMIFCFCMMMLLIGCNRNTIVNEYKMLPKNGWEKTDTLRFNVSIDDSLSKYDFYIQLRHAVDYRYSNIYFFTQTTFPDGSSVRDTIEMALAQPNGEWWGKGFGSIKSIKQQIVRAATLREGIYMFEFIQAMREDTLKGVQNMGIYIEKYIE